MFSPKTAVAFAMSASFLIAQGVQARGGGHSTRGWRSSSSSNFWFMAYSFSTINFPSTPGSMEEFGRHCADVMWQNRPAKAEAAICINGPWFAKNYDNVSPVVQLSYFKKKNPWLAWSTNKIRNWDCLYVWGPDQQFYSEDVTNFDRMAVRLDTTKCSLDNATMDVSCLGGLAPRPAV